MQNSLVIRLFLLCALFFIGRVCEAYAYENTFGDDYPFIIVTKDTVSDLPEMNDKEFYQYSLSVTFQVNRTNIRRDDPFLAIYRNEILPRINNDHLQLRKIYIRGAASPEGDYENNRRLGRGRSQALLNELQRDLQHQYLNPEISMTSITEDYGRLCLLMEEANDVDYPLVKEIYDRVQGDERQCKAELMKAQGGRLWKRMLAQYFPTLRSASIIIWFSEPDLEHAPLPELPHLPLTYSDAQVTLDPGTSLPLLSSKALGALLPETGMMLPYYATNGVYKRRHLLAVRTNLLHDFFYMPGVGWSPSPNVQLEYYPLKGHLTYNIGMTWGTHRHWDTHEFFQMRDFQAEVRRYFKGGGRFMGLYLGAYAEYNVYGIGLDEDTGWEGEGAAVGLTLGYVMPLTRKKNLRMEFMLGAGYYVTLFDPYVWGNPVTGTVDGKYYYNYLGSASSFKRRNHITTWLGPLNAGIQLTYDILYRKRRLVQDDP